MSLPRRWLDEEGSLLREERDLLRSGLTIDPPDGAQDRVWASVLAQLGPGPMGGSPGGGGPGGGLGGPAVAKGGVAAIGAGKAASVAASAGIVKSMLVGAAAAGIFLVGYAVVVPEGSPKPQTASIAAPLESALRPAVPQVMAPALPPAPQGEARERESIERHAAAPRSPAAPEAPERSRLRAVAEARPAPEEAVTAPPTGVEVAPSGGGSEDTSALSVAAAERESRLREERQLVGDARSTLRRGDISGALALLEQGRVRFPGGAMVQEREALTIEALWLGGQRSVASQRAAAFLRAYPLSPHAGRLQAFVQQP